MCVASRWLKKEWEMVFEYCLEMACVCTTMLVVVETVLGWREEADRKLGYAVYTWALLETREAGL
ncbi:hypothetical protein IF1G_06825 [Cordyceps javanica]|uniref:Uncharacterized protein n=1 Tax=Cordyceps javanica TaxID=43265 RepID=A0A545UZB8_9HYPO|nr:hypothetical protein IF1G_06825 [Cordyceps javanica]